MPENKNMKIQWMQIDGRNVPFVLPQVWNPDINDWEVTGSDKPLPTKDNLSLNKLNELDQKIDGIIDGTTPANTQLTGSKVEYGFVEEVIILNAVTLDTVDTSISETIDLSNAGRSSIIIRNTQDADVIISLFGRNLGGANTLRDANNNPQTYKTSSSHEYHITDKDFQTLGNPIKNIAIGYQAETLPTKGSLSISVLKWRI